MKVLLRVLSIVPAAIALLLVYAVSKAVFFLDSGERVRVWICVLYLVIAVVLSGVVVLMWRAQDSKSPVG